MGWGDELMATGEARMLKQKYPNHKILIQNDYFVRANMRV